MSTTLARELLSFMYNKDLIVSVCHVVYARFKLINKYLLWNEIWSVRDDHHIFPHNHPSLCEILKESVLSTTSRAIIIKYRKKLNKK